MGAGYTVTLKNIGTGVVTIALATNTNKLDLVTNGTVTLTPQQSRTYKLAADVVTYELVADANIGTLIGGVIDYAGVVSTVPGGFLVCDGSAVNRTTYAALFAAIGTAWGVGDGSTTFNLPPLARFALAAGQATFAETLTSVAASSNQVPVASNNTKWITGMQVVTSGVTGFGGTLNNGTYYISRINATHIKFHTTLAGAQNGTSVATVTGTGSMVITWTGTSRALGEIGGEETHAMSSAELLAHTHLEQSGPTSAAGTTAPLNGGPVPSVSTDDFSTASTGGNAAMNIMPPYAVYNKLIRAL